MENDSGLGGCRSENDCIMTHFTMCPHSMNTRTCPYIKGTKYEPKSGFQKVDNNYRVRKRKSDEKERVIVNEKISQV